VTGAGVGMTGSEIVTGDVPGGPSTSQTIMVSSLQLLLAIVPPDSAPASYRAAVMAENVLGKQTVSGREWAFRQLRRFYALNPQSLLFRALRDLWDHDKAGQWFQPPWADLGRVAGHGQGGGVVIADAHMPGRDLDHGRAGHPVGGRQRIRRGGRTAQAGLHAVLPATVTGCPGTPSRPVRTGAVGSAQAASTAVSCPPSRTRT
jgi:hypothetical protein